MALTGAQVKQLRSMAHHLNPAIIIGKSDVNEGTVEQTVAYLEKHELVKCSVLDGSSLSAREAAEELSESCHAGRPGHRPQVLAVSRVLAQGHREDQARLRANDPASQHMASLRVPKYFGRPFFIARPARD